jgi:multicomponent Na+:H+ antiporter subunit D
VLALAVPLLSACLLLAFGPRLAHTVSDAIAIATGVCVVVTLTLLLVDTVDGRVVATIGGWQPNGHHGVGIPFVADPMNTSFALLAAILLCVALLYGWRYFESVEARFHALMLLFLAAMIGFTLTGDLFNMLVFFELMGAVGYALTGQKVEEPQSVQGAFNFGVINSLGAYFSLAGIGLLYAKTGQLGFAALGMSMRHSTSSALIAAAFVLIMTGLVVKAAVVPFHFWLADAHAVAPTPVCVLFSGVMAQLGIYGVLRIYHVVFEPVLDPAGLSSALLVFGTASAVLGSVMCVGQRNLKRMLAYSTIAHGGLLLCAVAVFRADAAAGLLLYVLGHAGAKAALFLLTGTLLNRHGNVDEDELFGCGRPFPLQGTVFVFAAMVLAGLPPFGPALAKTVIEHSAELAGHGWVLALFVMVSALTGAAALRAGLRVYFGRGVPPATRRERTTTTGEGEQPETVAPIRRTPATMLAAVGALVALTIVVGVVPQVGELAALAGGYVVDGAGYARQVADGVEGQVVVPHIGWSATGALTGTVSVLLAAALAVVALRRLTMPPRLRWISSASARIMLGLRQLHSGHLGDYVAWLLVGVTGLGMLITL